MMRGTLRVFHAELVRLMRSRSAWGLVLVLAALSALRVLAVVGPRVAEGGGAAGGPISSGAAWAPFVDGWRAGLTLGCLGLLVYAARSIAGDREQGVLRLAVTRSVSRPALVWGRLLLAPLPVLGVVAATGLAAGLVASRFGDFGPLVEDGYELLSADEMGAELRSSVLGAIPALIATYAFGLLVSTLARGATGAVATALGLFLAFDLFKESLGRSAYWVFAAYAPTLADGSALGEMSGVARGFSDAGFPGALLRMNHLLPWPQALACAGLGAWILSRRTL